MRTFILYLLLVATLLPTISSWGIIAHYQLNKESIARILCQNRNRPELHCDGSCYLARRLKSQQDKQDQETINRVVNSPVVQLFCTDCSMFTCEPHEVDRVGIHSYTYLLLAYSTLLPAVFHPPGRTR
ncbi:hypothetical protein GCM10028805_57810 [Spirosoma harenae]